jgi:hypothetical protein
MADCNLIVTICIVIATILIIGYFMQYRADKHQMTLLNVNSTSNVNSLTEHFPASVPKLAPKKNIVRSSDLASQLYGVTEVSSV